MLDLADSNNIYNVLQGKKVRLRARSIEDVDREESEYELNKNLRHRDTEISRNFWSLSPPSPVDFRRDEKIEEIKSKNTCEKAYYMIETVADNTAVGSIGPSGVEMQNGHFAYALGIFREHWRKGYASEAVKLLLNFYFNNLRFHKCSPCAFEFNKGSMELHVSLGFKEEGRHRDRIFTNGRFYDMVQYGMIDYEFNKMYPEYLREL